ncbi:MAG: ABC transporter permease [Kiloniellales bacterium]
MDLVLIIESLPKFLEGTLLTVELVGQALIYGMAIAIPVALMRVSRNPLIWVPAYGYIFFFRGTPLLVQIFLIYYGSGQFRPFFEDIGLWPVLREAYLCAIIAFTLNTAAYTAEIIRGGIEGVPFGEVEAARACGMSKVLLYRRIILPRAFRLALQAYGNEVVLMLQASVLASTITLLDLMGVARTLNARFFAWEMFLVAAVFYQAMVYVITRVFKLVEYRLSPHLRAAPDDFRITRPSVVGARPSAINPQPKADG